MTQMQGTTTLRASFTLDLPGDPIEKVGQFRAQTSGRQPGGQRQQHGLKKQKQVQVPSTYCPLGST